MGVLYWGNVTRKNTLIILKFAVVRSTSTLSARSVRQSFFLSLSVKNLLPSLTSCECHHKGFFLSSHQISCLKPLLFVWSRIWTREIELHIGVQFSSSSKLSCLQLVNWTELVKKIILGQSEKMPCNYCSWLLCWPFAFSPGFLDWKMRSLTDRWWLSMEIVW